jgi:hypothetical protein
MIPFGGYIEEGNEWSKGIFFFKKKHALQKMFIARLFIAMTN